MTEERLQAPEAEVRLLPTPDLARRAQRRRTRESSLVLGFQVGLVLLIVAGAYLLNAFAGKLVMPSPTDVFRQFVRLWSSGVMLNALGQSLAVLLGGYALSIVTGIVGGMLLGGFGILRRVFDPFVNALNSTPGVAFIPLIIVWFGLYTEAKIVVVWQAALFPILIATAAGIGNANQDLVEMARSFGANRTALFWRVMLPDAIPTIVSGLRIGAAIATVGTIVAELYMAQSGLGGLLADAGARFQMDRYFAVVVVVMALGTVISAGLRQAERRLARWRVAESESR